MFEILKCHKKVKEQERHIVELEKENNELLLKTDREKADLCDKNDKLKERIEQLEDEKEYLKLEYDTMARNHKIVNRIGERKHRENLSRMRKLRKTKRPCAVENFHCSIHDFCQKNGWHCRYKERFIHELISREINGEMEI
jgi:hypothetical protein